jgi:hypothetical protein
MVAGFKHWPQKNPKKIAGGHVFVAPIGARAIRDRGLAPFVLFVAKIRGDWRSTFSFHPSTFNFP